MGFADLERAKAELEAELRLKQEHFIKKERVYKTKIDVDEHALARVREARTQWMQEDDSMQKLRDMHSHIIQNVGVVQQRTAHLVQEQESDLLRAFRARLLDVQMELEKEKAKADDGSAAWIDRSRQLEAEVDREKDRADRLDRVNQAQGKENQLLKQQFQTQEDDRNFLVKQLVSVKRKNQELRDKLLDHQQALQKTRTDLGIPADNDAISTLDLLDMKPGSASNANASSTPNGDGTAPPRRLLPRQEADSRYKEIIRRITRMLDMERRHRKQVQLSLDELRASRTSLEVSLRRAMDSVASSDGLRRAAIQPRLSASDSSAHSRAFHGYAADSFDQEQRERIIETWLSFEGVVETLCESDADAPQVAASPTKGEARRPKTPQLPKIGK